jgi:hypothetical protein
MSGRAPISDYLRELAVALPGPRRRRERILAEVEDHLRLWPRGARALS